MDEMIAGAKETPEIRVSFERLREVAEGEPELVPLLSFRRDQQLNETFVDCGLVSGQTVVPAGESPCSGADQKSLTDLIAFLIAHVEMLRPHAELARDHAGLGPPSPAPGTPTGTNLIVRRKVHPWNPLDDPPDAWERRFGGNYEN